MSRPRRQFRSGATTARDGSRQMFHREFGELPGPSRADLRRRKLGDQPGRNDDGKPTAAARNLRQRLSTRPRRAFEGGARLLASYLEGAQYSFAERRRGGGHGGYQVDDQGA